MSEHRFSFLDKRGHAFSSVIQRETCVLLLTPVAGCSAKVPGPKVHDYPIHALEFTTAGLAHGAVPSSSELLADLTGIQYGYVLREGRNALILERKEAMKARGLASPDLADALALTFAYPVTAPRSVNHPSWPARSSLVVTDWDPYRCREDRRSAISQ